MSRLARHALERRWRALQSGRAQPVKMYRSDRSASRNGRPGGNRLATNEQPRLVLQPAAVIRNGVTFHPSLCQPDRTQTKPNGIVPGGARLKTLKIADVDLELFEAGQGSPVLFLHGAGGF